MAACWEVENYPRPLGDKPGIGSKDEVQINMRRRAGEKTLGFMASLPSRATQAPRFS